MGKRSILTAVGIAALALVASACSIDVERNADGSLQVDAVVTEQSMAAELERDPFNENVVVDIADGYLTASADRKGLGGNTNFVSFRADLSVAGETLTVSVSEATFDGFPIPESIVAQWNDDLARAIERAARQHPDAELVSVTLANDELAMEWRIETPESKGS